MITQPGTYAIQHPRIKKLIIIRVDKCTPDTADHTIGLAYEGWLNDQVSASNYFTLKLHPKAGWLANLGSVWKTVLTGPELAKLVESAA